MNQQINQRLSVPFDFPVIFSEHIFAPDNRALLEAMTRLGESRRHRALIFVDANVEARYPGLQNVISAYFSAHPDHLEIAGEPQIVPGGEQIKNDFSCTEQMIESMLAARMDRHSFIIAVGGGAVLDAVGFAASLVHRGLRIIRVPTTVLSQNDGGVGVKTGINFRGGKNALGTFAPPFAVLNDFQFLLTLDNRAWLDGVAEAFKVAIIRDARFFDFLKSNAAQFRARDFGAMQELVFRCAQLHLDHIRTGGDPFEFGRARPLDFGHWSAHKLELLSNFKISHGEAVAVGVLLDSCYATGKGWLSQTEFTEIHRAFLECGLPVWFDELEQRDAKNEPEIFGGITDFQEHLGGELSVTFPDGIGQRQEVHEIDRAAMSIAIKSLKNHARG